jgi:S-DNA-T family DNA segregation ATPase FtsK/SpoIIIE
MAKKQKKKSKEVGKQHELPGGFWKQIFAIVLILIAVLLVLTWFGGGGDILNSIHSGGLWLIGYSVYILPFLLVPLAVMIFRSPDNMLPTIVWISAILLIVFTSGAFGIPTIGEKDPTGGVVGEGLNGIITKIVEPGVAFLIYAVLIFITILFVFKITPKTIFKQISAVFSSTKTTEDKQNAKVARELGEKFVPKEGVGELKVNNAMVGDDHKKPSTDKALPKADLEEKKALVAVSDPNWKMPSIDLLEKKQSPPDAGNIQQNALIIKNTLKDFDIEVEMEGANIGPRVTQYTMRPQSGVNLSKIVGRDRELALNLAADKIRIEAPIPGTRSVGIEIPNVKSADVRLRGVLEAPQWQKADGKLTFAVGKDISGNAIVADLAKMPHLLIAGTTGSGKSVMMNTLLTSLLYHNSPSDMKLIIVDPKQVEMAQYEDIPHLLTPIITQPDKTLSALKWAVDEMEKRYSLMAKERVKNITDYNTKMERGKVAVADEDGNEQEYDGGRMPYIVLVVDEMADLMMMAGKDLEMLVVRVAQKGRAAGIHLVLATQRPEVKIITGLIKANIPGRIAFAVGSQIDSRVMLDMVGAEKLLGKGDMLLLTTEMMGKPRRVQGALTSDEDVSKLTDFLRDQSPPQYDPDVISQAVQIKGLTIGGETGNNAAADLSDPIYRQVVEFALSKGNLSNSDMMRKFQFGFQKAGRIIDNLEDSGVIAPKNGNKPRELLISSLDEFDMLAEA